MSVTELSESAQNYLKTVWSLGEWSREPVTAGAIAEAMGVSKSSVSDAVKRLSSQGLLAHAPYGSVELTDQGRAHAVAMVRRHRLLETFLVEILGYTWDQVHEEAEVLEHSVSDFMVERIAERLGHPDRDPHGDPIPNREGMVETPKAVALTDVSCGITAKIERISDSDPRLLKYFTDLGIDVGGTVRKVSETTYTGGMSVLVGDSADPVQLGTQATDALFVAPLD